MDVKITSRNTLVAAAAAFASSYFHFENGPNPGPYDDAQMEYQEDQLLVAARIYVKAHEGHRTAEDEYLENLHGEPK